MRHFDKDPEQLTSEDLERYKGYLAIEKGYSKNSLYTAIKAIQAFFRFLKLNTAESLTPPKRPVQNPKYLTEEEAHRLLEAARPNPKDYAILMTFCYTGLRVSEICSLTVDDVDFNQKVICVRSGKGDKDRIVPIEEKTTEALKNYMECRDATIKHLFISNRQNGISPRTIERLVRKYAKLAEIEKKVTPHILRHTFATTLLRHGADIRFIQAILGHANIATTQVYTHVDDEALRKVYEKAKPNY